MLRWIRGYHELNCREHHFEIPKLGSRPNRKDEQTMLTCYCAADRKEFLKISQAIAMGFVAMGAVGYIVKLSTSFSSYQQRLDS